MLGALLVTGAIYARGWRILARRTNPRFGEGALAAFLGGLGVIAVALASPLDALAGRRLSAHMTQHQLLIAAVWLVMQALNATHAPRLSEAKRAIGSVRGKSHRAGSPAR